MIRVIQPALPVYRLDFFSRLQKEYGCNFRVYHSRSDMGNISAQTEDFDWAVDIGSISQLCWGLEWQAGVMAIPIGQRDILVVCGAPKTISTLCLLIKARILGVKTVWWGHYWGANTTPLRLYLRLIFARLSHGVLFYTDSEVLKARRTRVLRRMRISALNNGLDYQSIEPHRRKYVFTERNKNILFIGRLTPKSELDLLINSIVLLNDEAYMVHVIGSGQMFDAFSSAAAEFGVADNFSWYGDVTDEKKISEIANKCSLFVYPGQVGLSLIHAMAYGLPAIVHSDRLRHMPEIAAFKDGSTGLSFKDQDARSLCRQLRHFEGLEATVAESLSEQSIREVEINFNTSVMAERFVEFIDEIK